MMKHLFVIAAIAVILSGLTPAQGTDAKRLTETRETVRNIGSGPKAKVEVKLANDTKVKGTIDRIDADSFIVTDGNGRQTTVNYTEVKEVKKGHSGLKPLTWAIIGGAAAAAIIIGVTVIHPILCDGGAAC